MSYTKSGDRPRVMVPVALAAATAKSKTALWAYIGIASFADFNTGRSSCTTQQAADAVGLGRTQISSGIAWLVENGWVERLVRGTKQSGASVYLLRMQPCQRSESRTLEHSPVSGFPDVDESATFGKSNVGALPTAGNPDVESAPMFGKSASNVRKSGHSPELLQRTNTPLPPTGGESATTTPDDGSLLPDLTPQPAAKKTAPKRTTTYPDAFEEFWETYPKRRGTERGSKPAALKAWTRATATIDADLLAAAASAYGDDKRNDLNYIKDASGWLNGELYEPYLAKAARAQDGPTVEQVRDVLGPELFTLPAVPRGIDYGTEEYRDWKTRAIAKYRAERVAQYHAVIARRTA